MATSLAKKKTGLKKQDKHSGRLQLIYAWVKNDDITYSQFHELMGFLEVIDDVKDAEFTEARLKELREKK